MRNPEREPKISKVAWGTGMALILTLFAALTATALRSQSDSQNGSQVYGETQ